jgi:hypothetical protein
MRLVSNSDKSSRFEKFRLGLYCLSFLFLGLFLGWKNVPGFLKANFILLTDSKVLASLVEENNLETLHLSVSFKNLQKIEAKRDDALSKGKLESSDDDLVRAVISSGKEQLDCKIRLKGDLSDHWSGDKWSLRVEMKGDGLIKGMSRFSLQDPQTRKGTDEWLFLNSLTKEDCMIVRYHFVNLVINGKERGIYAMEEHFSKEMIEANQRREGVIVTFDEHLIWRKYPPHLFDNINWDTIFRSSGLVLRNSKRVHKSESLTRQKETAFNLLRNLQEEQLKGSEIFSTDKLGKFLALTHLWNAEHVLGPDDINFYFNPVTSLLEPIGCDAGIGTYSHFCFFTSGEMRENWMNFALRDPAIASSYVKHLVEYSSVEYVDSLKDKLADEEFSLRKLLLGEFIGQDFGLIWKYANKIFNYDPWETLRKRAEKIRNELSEEYLIIGYARPMEGNDSLEIILRNTTTQPIEIAGFQCGDMNWTALDSIAEPDSKAVIANTLNGNLIIKPRNVGKWAKPLNHRFILTKNQLLPDKFESLKVQCRFLGNPAPLHSREIPVDRFRFIPEELPFHKNSSGLAELSSFLSEDNRTFFLPAGDHLFTSSVFIPPEYKLVIAPGATLSFSENSVLASRSPIIAIGTAESPIAFTSTNESWPGILLAQAKEDSHFEHVKFNKISGIGKEPNPNGITSNGWSMTGAVTIYESTSHFSSCSFDGLITEDALNIISSSFSLDSCTFGNLFSDAFDGDFVNGEVRNCTFSDIKGDGVDFSGSQVSVINCTFADVKDKAISIGEGSQVSVKTSNIDRVSFGIVSKDLSQATISDCKIADAGIAGFSAYQKKNSFGPAQMKISNSQVVDSAKAFLVQDGSTVWEDDVEVRTVPLDVERLYANE